MARARSVGRAVCCASLALLLSFTLFWALLRAQVRWPGAGGQASIVTTVDVHVPRDAAEARSDDESAPVLVSAPLDHGDEENGAVTTVIAGAESYVPVSQLTEKPQLLRDIDAEWHLPGVSLPIIVATLLISEYGDIDRIELQGPSLSPMLEQDLRARFSVVRFSPGKLHGQPVRSALRIEVCLD